MGERTRTKRKAPTRTPTKNPTKHPPRARGARVPIKEKERKLLRPKTAKMRRSKKATMTSHLALVILQSTLGIRETAATRTENIYESTNRPAHLDFEVGVR